MISQKDEVTVMNCCQGHTPSYPEVAGVFYATPTEVHVQVLLHLIYLQDV
jgi:hypothetical protein